MKHRKVKYNPDIFYTFDIETTTIVTGCHQGKVDLNAIVYSGQFYDGSVYTQVRDIEHIIKEFESINKKHPKEDGYILVYVHFLSYEFQFLKDFFNFYDIIATAKRKIIVARWKNLEFRCSYFLSNMSLDKFLKSEEVEEDYQKTKLDFTVRRYPWTPLTASELKYMENDVVGLHKAICNMTKKLTNSNKISNLALTNTGFVRRDMRKAFLQDKNKWFNQFQKYKMNMLLMTLCMNAFRGGDCHANRINATKLMENVMQVDIVSSYTFEMLVNGFPTVWHTFEHWKEKDFWYFYKRREDYALIFDIYMVNTTLKENIAVPYIPLSKVEHCHNFSLDNGRILKMETGKMTITEVDFEIILAQYDIESYKLDNIYFSRKQPLDQSLKDTIMEYFYKKSSLKGVDDYYYAKSKNRLNSCYGMIVTKPIREEWIFNKDSHEVEIDNSMTFEEKLEEFYSDHSNFLSYQQGIYVTAYARRSLHELISKIDFRDYIYNDTDSCKFVYREKYKKIVAELNEKRKELALKNGAYVEVNGKTYIMGQWEFEGISPKFKSWGAKKYMYTTDYQSRRNGHKGFNITISGVPKEAGIKCIIEDIKAGKLNSPFDIDENYVFKNVKSQMIFNDVEKPYYFDVDGHKVLIHSNIGAIEGNYTFGFSSDYKQLLAFLNKEKEPTES